MKKTFNGSLFLWVDLAEWKRSRRALFLSIARLWSYVNVSRLSSGEFETEGRKAVEYGNVAREIVFYDTRGRR